MAYYTVGGITDRRVNEDDGTIEYAVRWEGEVEEVTWEKHRQLIQNCGEMVQAVNQRCVDATDAELKLWRRGRWTSNEAAVPPGKKVKVPKERQKRSRSVTPEPPQEQEVLNALLLRPRCSSHVADCAKGKEEETEKKREEKTGEEAGLVLLLGEVVLSEEASAALHRTSDHKKRRLSTAASAGVALHTSPALELEKRWRDTHGQRLLRSVEVAHSIDPFWGNYRAYHSSDVLHQAMAIEAQRSMNLRILHIAPPHTTFSGAVYSAPVALHSLVGTADVEQLQVRVQHESPAFGSIAQELGRPHMEQMVVRYALPAATLQPTAADATSTMDGLPSSGDRITSMPLSIFRVVFPQLLIDYLLQRSLVLH